jgi:hypothetical protein
MVDVTVLEDPTLQRLIVGIIAGLSLGMVLEIVLRVLAGSALMPAVFIGVLVLVTAVLVLWSTRLK